MTACSLCRGPMMVFGSKGSPILDSNWAYAFFIRSTTWTGSMHMNVKSTVLHMSEKLKTKPHVTVSWTNNIVSGGKSQKKRKLKTRKWQIWFGKNEKDVFHFHFSKSYSVSEDRGWLLAAYYYYSTAIESIQYLKTTLPCHFISQQNLTQQTSSYTFSCTNKRLVDVHLCPAVPTDAKTVAGITMLRSASSFTIMALLPPSSRSTYKRKTYKKLLCHESEEHLSEPSLHLLSYDSSDFRRTGERNKVNSGILNV